MELLFSNKELYIAEHTKDGGLARLRAMKKSDRAKLTLNNMHLVNNIPFSTYFPLINSFNESVDGFGFIPYHKWRQVDSTNTILHFFEEDYLFDEAIWDKLEPSTWKLRDFAIRIGPDFSMWQNVHESFNFVNTLRSRVVTAYWQKNGFPTIPVVSWGTLQSLRYCLDGLPRNSVLAVCGTGLKKPENFNLWCEAMQYIEKELQPTMFLIYGEPYDLPMLRTSVKYIQPQTSFFRENDTN